MSRIDDQLEEQVAKGVLAYEILIHFLANRISYGHLNAVAICELVDHAESRAISLYGNLDLQIAESADNLRQMIGSVPRQ